jgi:hypothetical protein
MPSLEPTDRVAHVDRSLSFAAGKQQDARPINDRRFKGNKS